MLRRIEPLDTSVISKGVSDSAKDSMKQTISSMLGLLPSDQFVVSVRVLKRPLDRLLMSSIITGYTLWNAEYRISLKRNFDIPTDDWKRAGEEEGNVVPEVKRLQSEGEVGGDDVDSCERDMENLNLPNFEGLSPKVLSYIQQLELKLSSAKQELDTKKQENIQMESARGSHNDLLDYLRSLDSDMVNELSRPSSIEVEEITHHLVQNILRKFFVDESSCEFKDDLAIKNIKNEQKGDEESSDTVCTSRDYLAKLLFWCMLLGHHLRGLENRLHLSCAVGLL